MTPAAQPPQGVTAWLPALEAQFGRAPEGTALYVHLPFCVAKCTYCDFFSVASAGHDIERMVEAILREAAMRAPRAPGTVFFGGGTPSLLSTSQLARLLDGLDELTNWRQSASEVTAECNPESLDRDKARALVDLGVTRLSIGFQSLRPALLELFGRVHDAQQSFAAFEAARASGARQVSVDLIYAAPGQRLSDWCQDLERVLELEPDHLSAYNLTFEEETPFQRWLEQGKLSGLGDELELEFFHATRERLAAGGWRAYEISNFARPGAQCAHNLNYWRNGAYVGLGPSAASKIGAARAGNVRHIELYRARAERDQSALVWSESLEPRARLAETWWLGLRLAEGVDPLAARLASGASASQAQAVERAAMELVEQGLLQRLGARVSLSERGLPLADAVAKRLLRIDDEA